MNKLVLASTTPKLETNLDFEVATDIIMDIYGWLLDIHEIPPIQEIEEDEYWSETLDDLCTRKVFGVDKWYVHWTEDAISAFEKAREEEYEKLMSDTFYILDFHKVAVLMNDEEPLEFINFPLKGVW